MFWIASYPRSLMDKIAASTPDWHKVVEATEGVSIVVDPKLYVQYPRISVEFTGDEDTAQRVLDALGPDFNVQHG